MARPDYVRNGKRLLHFRNIINNMQWIEIFDEGKLQIIRKDGSQFHMTAEDAKLFLERFFETEYQPTDTAERAAIVEPAKPPEPKEAKEPPAPEASPYSKPERLGPGGIPNPT